MNLDKLRMELRERVNTAARESANEHIKFTASNFPEWAKGHESELAAIFAHYAEIGAREAMNYLHRNAHI